MRVPVSLFVLALLILISCEEDPVTPDIEIPDGYSLLWQDEFRGSSINMAHWSFQTGDGTDYNLPAGWGNNELQNYTTDEANAGIEQDGDDGVLRITAIDLGEEIIPQQGS